MTPRYTYKGLSSDRQHIRDLDDLVHEFQHEGGELEGVWDEVRCRGLSDYDTIEAATEALKEYVEFGRKYNFWVDEEFVLITKVW